MKKLISFAVLLLMFGMASVYSQESSALEGVWEMVYSKLESPDTITIRSPDFKYVIIVYPGGEDDTLIDPYPINPAFKIFTEKHFSLSRINDDNQFVGHFGTYAYDGKTYVENIKFSSFKSIVGQSVKFKSSMEGDKWTIKGVMEFQGEEWKLKETWQRVE